MANKRMFSQEVVCSDRFRGMTVGAQALYFQACLGADDDGIVANMESSRRTINARKTCVEELIANGFILVFNAVTLMPIERASDAKECVFVVKDWHLMNNIRKDRYTCSARRASLKGLKVLKNGQYFISGTEEMADNWQTDDGQMDANSPSNDGEGEYSLVQHSSAYDSLVQLSPDQYSLGESSKGASSPMSNAHPTLEELEDYIIQNGMCVDANTFFNYYTSNGWMVGKNPMTNWKYSVKAWHNREVKKNQQNNTESQEEDKYKVVEML